MGALPSRLSAGVADYMARRRGPLRGRWSLCPVFPSFQSFSLPISYTETHPEPSFRSSLTDTYTIVSLRHTRLFCLCHTYTPIPSAPPSPSLSSPVLPPPPLICSGICGDASLALPIRDAKNGDNFWTDDLAAPRASPLQTAYYLICSSS
ncbi:unnamed protein product [Pipistrellus nathusii]|uniref:Uncharacterized protein n=1 Tax=Pipistrellus nathusii TaxID=59473 RepID=A0ABP0AE44_PIPNA